MKRSDTHDKTPAAPPEFLLLGERLRTFGLVVRGGFDVETEDRELLDRLGKKAESIILVGNAGGVFWPIFDRWREDQPAKLENPLDIWSRKVISEAVEGMEASFISPSERPYMPFQQWAMRAEGLRPSPLGILMHPEWGLWHAYRGALLFDQPLGLACQAAGEHLCDSCIGKPCLKACPVDAYSATRFDYQHCLAHVRGRHGEPCRSSGCLDRNVCPFAAEYRYPADMQAFIMRAYAGL